MIIQKHYLKSALNSFRRNKWYTLLMVFSLSAGMYCFVLAGIYIDYEFSRNSNHEHADIVHRVMVKIGDTSKKTYLPISFAEQLADINPAVEALSLLDVGNGVYASVDGDAYISEDDVFFGNPGFFEVFSFPLSYGNAEEALKGIRSIVISERLSELFFPGKNPVGESLTIHEQGVFQITGVLAPVSNLSIIKPGILFTQEYYQGLQPRQRFTQVNLTHIKLKEPMDIAELEATLYKDFQQYFNDDGIGGIYTEKLIDEYWGTSHFDYGAQFSSLMGRDKQMIRIVGYVSFGVLLCAFIGYLSLALSLSIKRSKEIGIRKVNGARSVDIRVQLLAESVFYALFSLLVTVVALELSADYFSGLFQVPMGLALTQTSTIVSLLAFTIITGLLAGAYPALVVSRIKPVSILSGTSNPLSSSFKLKRVLLITQLSVTVVLVFSVFVLRLQVNEMSAFNSGYDKEQVVSFDVHDASIKKNYTAIVEEMNQVAGVQSLTGGPFPFAFSGFRKVRIQLQDSLIEETVARVRVANNFFEVMDIPLVAGEGFQEGQSTPLSTACMVNEAFAMLIGGDVLGMTIEYDGQPRTIQGIVKNYADWGVNNPKANAHVYLPVAEPTFHSLLVKFDEEHLEAGVTRMNEIWRKYETVKEPNVLVLADREELSTIGLSKRSVLFGFLALVVLILGMFNLFGIAAMYAGSKQKDVSIRRILGAETLELFRRLSTPFVSALLISLLIALPVAYGIMDNYLTRYAVRVSMGALPGVAVVTAMVALLFVVIGYQLFRSSKINPVDSLKSE